MAPRPLPALAALSLLASGCAFPAAPSAGPLVVHESEPNDFPELANWVATVYPGQSLALEGALFGADPQDGFELVAGEPCSIDLALTAHDPQAAFGVCLYDPVTGLMPFCFASGANPELGGFDVFVYDYDFHLVVIPLWGAAQYTLNVNVHPLGPAPEGGPPAPSERVRPRATTPSADPAVLERARAYLSPPARAEAEAAPRLRPWGLVVTVAPDGRVRERAVWTRQALPAAR